MRSEHGWIAPVTGALLVAIAGGGCGGGGDAPSPFFVPTFLASDVRVDTDPAGAASSEAIRLAVYCRPSAR